MTFPFVPPTTTKYFFVLFLFSIGVQYMQSILVFDEDRMRVQAGATCDAAWREVVVVGSSHCMLDTRKKENMTR